MPQFEHQGIELFYDLKGQGNETVVFLNGIMMSTESWKMQSDLFSKKYTVLLNDFRGQGRSSMPDEPYTFDQHVEDLKALLDHLKITSAHFVGTSYGAEVGMKFALKYPKQIKTLTLATAVSESDFLLKEKVESWAIAARHAISYGEKADFFLLSAPFNFSSPFLEKNPDFYEKQIAKIKELPDSWFKAFIRLCDCFKTLDATKELHKLKMPVFVLAGEYDILKSVRFSAIMSKKISNVEAMIVMDAGHALVIEKAAEFNSAVTGFIDKHS